MRTDQDMQPLSVAKILSNVIEEEEPDVVIVGKQSIDSDANQTGQILAGILGWPQATFGPSGDIPCELCCQYCAHTVPHPHVVYFTAPRCLAIRIVFIVPLLMNHWVGIPS